LSTNVFQCAAGLIPQSLQFQKQVMNDREPRHVTWQDSARISVLCAIGAVEVPLFVCLRSSCNDVSKVGGH